MPSQERAGPPSKASELTSGPSGFQVEQPGLASQLSGSGVAQFFWSSVTAGRVETHRFSLARLPGRPEERIISRPSRRRMAVRVLRDRELSPSMGTATVGVPTGTPGPQVFGVLQVARSAVQVLT